MAGCRRPNEHLANRRLPDGRDIETRRDYLLLQRWEGLLVLIPNDDNLATSGNEGFSLSSGSTSVAFLSSAYFSFASVARAQRRWSPVAPTTMMRKASVPVPANLPTYSLLPLVLNSSSSRCLRCSALRLVPTLFCSVLLRTFSNSNTNMNRREII